MTEPSPVSRRTNITLLAIILAFGVFLRLPPHAFSKGAPLHSIAALHPQPAFVRLGFDEELYRKYTNGLIADGLGGYPGIVQAYIEVQEQRTGSILPPLRFLYIFTAYVWHSIFGSEPLEALHQVAAFFSMLTLALGALFVWRLRGPTWAVAVAALVAVAPTQLHMSQHALVDGFFTFWATLVLWFFWENLQAPRNWLWLTGYIVALTLLILTKENSFFVWVALVALLITNRWLQFGTITRELVIATILGPLLGVVILIFLAGGLDVLLQCCQLSVSKNLQLPYAIRTGDGPWYRYLVDLLLVSPIVLILALGTLFQTQSDDETGTLHVDLYRRQLSGDVQREIRNEPPLREHVGPAATLPCLQSNSNAGIVDKTIPRCNHRRRGRITRGDRVSSVHRPGGALPPLRVDHTRFTAGASDLEVTVAGYFARR